MKEKAAYLKGLIDGLGIDENTKEGKVIKAMSELLSEMPRTKRTTPTTRPKQTTMTTTPTWPVSLIMRWPALPAARPST